MSRVEKFHPRVFLCRCGTKHLAVRVEETPEVGDGWHGVKRHLESAA